LFAAPFFASRAPQFVRDLRVCNDAMHGAHDARSIGWRGTTRNGIAFG
jgi:hypothetical protein